MTPKVEAKARQWPCWLVGHRSTAEEVEDPRLNAYRETCEVCEKHRLFTVDDTGRHNKSGWKK